MYQKILTNKKQKFRNSFTNLSTVGEESENTDLYETSELYSNLSNKKNLEEVAYVPLAKLEPIEFHAYSTQYQRSSNMDHSKQMRYSKSGNYLTVSQQVQKTPSKEPRQTQLGLFANAGKTNSELAEKTSNFQTMENQSNFRLQPKIAEISTVKKPNEAPLNEPKTKADVVSNTNSKSLNSSTIEKTKTNELIWKFETSCIEPVAKQKISSCQKAEKFESYLSKKAEPQVYHTTQPSVCETAAEPSFYEIAEKYLYKPPDEPAGKSSPSYFAKEELAAKKTDMNPVQKQEAAFNHNTNAYSYQKTDGRLSQSQTYSDFFSNSNATYFDHTNATTNPNTVSGLDQTSEASNKTEFSYYAAPDSHNTQTNVYQTSTPQEKTSSASYPNTEQSFYENLKSQSYKKLDYEFDAGQLYHQTPYSHSSMSTGDHEAQKQNQNIYQNLNDYSSQTGESLASKQIGYDFFSNKENSYLDKTCADWYQKAQETTETGHKFESYCHAGAEPSSSYKNSFYDLEAVYGYGNDNTRISDAAQMQEPYLKRDEPVSNKSIESYLYGTAESSAADKTEQKSNFYVSSFAPNFYDEAKSNYTNVVHRSEPGFYSPDVYSHQKATSDFYSNAQPSYTNSYKQTVSDFYDFKEPTIKLERDIYADQIVESNFFQAYYSGTVDKNENPKTDTYFTKQLEPSVNNKTESDFYGAKSQAASLKTEPSVHVESYEYSQADSKSYFFAEPIDAHSESYIYKSSNVYSYQNTEPFAHQKAEPSTRSDFSKLFDLNIGSHDLDSTKTNVEPKAASNTHYEYEPNEQSAKSTLPDWFKTNGDILDSCKTSLSATNDYTSFYDYNNQHTHVY